MIPLTHYLILSGVLFAIGLMGVIFPRPGHYGPAQL